MGLAYQYLVDNRCIGRAKLEPLDNDRDPGIRWTSARAVLLARRKS